MKRPDLGFQLSSFFNALLYVVPIYSLLFYQDQGLSLTQIGILFSLPFVSSILFEIPTGIFADLFSRKYSTIFGLFLVVLSYIGIYFSSSYIAFLSFAALVGIGVTFTSGALESWTSDLLHRKNYTKVFARIESWYSAGSFISGFIAVYAVATFGIRVIFLLGALSFLLGLIVLAFLPKDRVKKKKINLENYSLHLKESYSEITRNKYLKRYMLATLFLNFALAFTAKLGWIPYFSELGVLQSQFGYIWSTMTFMGIFAPYLGIFVSKRMNDNRTMQLLMVLWITSLLLLLFTNNLFIVILILVLTLLFDFGRVPVQRGYFQKILPQKLKSTIGSFEGVVLSISSAIGYPLAGLLADMFSAKFILIFSAFLLMPVIYFFRK